MRELIIAPFPDGANDGSLPWGVVEIHDGRDAVILARLRSKGMAEEYAEWLRTR